MVTPAGPPAFVLDNSISLSWCLGDESEEYPTRVLLALRTTRARVPSLWPYEMANGLAVSERRNRLIPAGLQRALADLAALPIEVDPASHERGMGEVLALARQERLTARCRVPGARDARRFTHCHSRSRDSRGGRTPGRRAI